jgi:hypothetical protein
MIIETEKVILLPDDMFYQQKELDGDNSFISVTPNEEVTVFVIFLTVKN